MADTIKDTTNEEEPDDYMKSKKPSFSMPAFLSQIQREVMSGGSVDIKSKSTEEAKN